jgi:hypothetical protein
MEYYMNRCGLNNVCVSRGLKAQHRLNLLVRPPADNGNASDLRSGSRRTS